MSSIISKSKRIERLHERNLFLAQNHKRDLYVDNPEFLVYHWSGKAAAFSPATGETAASASERINCGDHNCRVDNGQPFPYTRQMPSKVNGFSYDENNFAADYAFFLDHTPVLIHPHERITGEFNWQLDEARFFQYPEENQKLGFEARKLGAGGISFTHTCPDLSIGLELGWGGILNKIQTNRIRFEANGNKKSADYLKASEVVCLSIIRFIERYAKEADLLANKESDQELKENYLIVAQSCRNIITGAPSSFIEAVQWINFFQVFERIIGHGNGYGRLDQLLIGFYKKDIEKGIITHEYARDLVAELFLKYGGNYFSFGGRNQELKDATNEMSWIGIEAYDMLGGYNQLGAMWHSDIDKDFWNYACDVVGRHGCGAPTLVNYDIMRASELRSGYSGEDCWNIAYSGCQWYCSVGKEYNDQDLNSLVLVQPMQRAMQHVANFDLQKWDDFWAVYCNEVNQTADALVDFKNNTYKWQHQVWPEMVTSFCMHGPIENGRDVTDVRAVANNYTSVNVLGVPNVVDSMFAIKELVFLKKKYTMKQLIDAVASNWDGQELMRRDFLNQPKFGNDIDSVDEMAMLISTQIRELLESKHNIKGFHFRPSLFQFMGHTYAGLLLGATPDGRKADEPLAHGMNPMHGRNTEGMLPTMRSFTKLNFAEYQGGSFQVELHPSFFPDGAKRGDTVELFSTNFFEMGGVQINLNVVDINTLKKAMENPEKPEYKNIVVKVTGYSSHFVVMDLKFQEEFIERVNYSSLVYMLEKSAFVTEIRSLSAHDGPGLRTTLYFKGCSLKCKWCHNPETIGLAPELEWDARTCMDCHICEVICPEKAIVFTEPLSYIIDKNRCTVCGICVDGCPSKSLRLIGTSYNVDQLFDRIHKDEKFTKRSNGGITFSGGEPALQYPFIAELAQKLKAAGYHLALDTCGAAPAKAYETLVPLMDLILYDLKEMNDKKHRQFTGSSNKLIHKNLLLVQNLIDHQKLKTELWIRTPLIPGMTDTPENILAIGEFLSQNNSVQKWELCTFNNLCIAKYRKLGLKWNLEQTELLTKDHAADLLVHAKFAVTKISSVTLSGLTKTNQTN